MNICMTGIDFQRANLSAREPVSFVQGQVETLLPKIRAFDGVLGCALLATCNRTELYLHTEHPDMDPLFVLCKTAGIPYDAYTEISTVRTDQDAVAHLMEVASGMQSQIFGDDQIWHGERMTQGVKRR